jgi:hypothetical protein
MGVRVRTDYEAGYNGRQHIKTKPTKEQERKQWSLRK